MVILTKREIENVDYSVSLGGYSTEYMLEKLNETMSEKIGLINFHAGSECLHIVELKMINDALDLLIEKLNE